ncbi:MAG: hypothetical protein FWH48_01960 [Oscillospiraceae bacterium]|nr:hypothetical protein [Oscillospiraceae bacterium]
MEDESTGDAMRIAAKELRELQKDVLEYFKNIGAEWCSYSLEIIAELYEKSSE